MQYAILANPGHNRVYFNASEQLSLGELSLAGARFRAGFRDLAVEMLGGVPYYTFATDEPLTAEDSVILSRLSFCYALFARQGEALLPLTKNAPVFFDAGLSTILKYSGKTNELFTRALLNAALYAGDFYATQGLRLLDPVAGKGTTLFEGLQMGYQVSGIEIGGKAVQEAAAYFKRYLQTEKYKHSYKKERVGGANKSFRATVHKFTFAPDKDSFKDAAQTGALTMVEGDSRYANQIFAKNSFHMVVGDLPYGVAHGNVTNEKQTSLTRNPAELLAVCLPAWYDVLKKGGTLALAWNSFVLPRAQLETLLTDHGFTVLNQPPYDQFAHQVDSSIRRDIVVGKK